jgi:glycosyltransferase involved in cell wall biosynthesis
VILTVCRLDKNKGVDVLIKSLGMLNSNDVNLLIVGEGVEQKALKELSSALGVQKNVTFLGFRNRKELLELYNLADLFALASYSEGLPRVLIEAMACGCVPIATSVGDVAAVVVDGFNGFTVNPGDYEKFAERIKEILSLSEEKIKLIQSRARRTVTDDFDSRKVIKKMVDSINSLYLFRNKSISKAKK